MSNWYLQNADENTFGPVDLDTLCAWAADGRIGPDDRISMDRRTWQAAPRISELEMNWTVNLPDGSTIGPLHLLALRELVLDGSLAPEANISHARTGRVARLGDELLPAIIELCRQTSAAHASPAKGLPADGKELQRLQQMYDNDLAAAQEEIDAAQRDAATRIATAEAAARAAQEEAEEARKRQEGADDAYRDVLKQFRELNDRYIRLNHEYQRLRAKPG